MVGHLCWPLSAFSLWFWLVSLSSRVRRWGHPRITQCTTMLSGSRTSRGPRFGLFPLPSVAPPPIPLPLFPLSSLFLSLPCLPTPPVSNETKSRQMAPEEESVPDYSNSAVVWLWPSYHVPPSVLGFVRGQPGQRRNVPDPERTWEEQIAALARNHISGGLRRGLVRGPRLSRIQCDVQWTPQAEWWLRAHYSSTCGSLYYNRDIADRLHGLAGVVGR